MAKVTVGSLKDKAEVLWAKAEALQKKQQAACAHPFKSLTIFEGAVSSTTHQELSIRCALCGSHFSRDLTLHKDDY